MPKCPNCGQATKRTRDWACQWCGYPLTSKSYKKVDKTYRQLKEERLGKPSPPAPEETEHTFPEPEAPSIEDTAATRIALTAAELYSVCTRDKVEAELRFADKTLAVTGAVVKIVADEDYGIFYLSMTGSPDAAEGNINCMFPREKGAELTNLTEGQTVTVEGTYDGYELNIMVKDCVLTDIEVAGDVVPLAESHTEETEPEKEQGAETESLAEPEKGIEEEKEVEPQPEEAPEPEEEGEVEPVLEVAPEPEPETEVKPDTEVEKEKEVEPDSESVEEKEDEPETEDGVTPVAEAEPGPEAVEAVEEETEPVKIIQPDMEITVEELLATYTADEAAAEDKFKDKVLKITGTVGRIEVRDYLDFDYINLTNAEGNILEHVRCFFAKESGPELNQLEIGQRITVQGTYDGSIISMRLKGCMLVS